MGRPAGYKPERGALRSGGLGRAWGSPPWGAEHSAPGPEAVRLRRTAQGWYWLMSYPKREFTSAARLSGSSWHRLPFRAAGFDPEIPPLLLLGGTEFLSSVSNSCTLY